MRLQNGHEDGATGLPAAPREHAPTGWTAIKSAVPKAVAYPAECRSRHRVTGPPTGPRGAVCGPRDSWKLLSPYQHPQAIPHISSTHPSFISIHTIQLFKILHILMIKISALSPLKVLVNAGHERSPGPASTQLAEAYGGSRPRRCDASSASLPRARWQFPGGASPTPLLDREPAPDGGPGRRNTGRTWVSPRDGDFDRCFFFDHEGDFVLGRICRRPAGRGVPGQGTGAEDHPRPPRRLGHAKRWWPRWAGRGDPVEMPGNSFIKQAMRETGAVYGGRECRRINYFRDFMACDSGMIPMLLMIELVSAGVKSLKASARRTARGLPFLRAKVNFPRGRPDGGDRGHRGGNMPPRPRRGTRPTVCRSPFGDWRFNLRGLEHRAAFAAEHRGARQSRSLCRRKLAEMRALIEALTEGRGAALDSPPPGFLQPMARAPTRGAHGT